MKSLLIVITTPWRSAGALSRPEGRKIGIITSNEKATSRRLVATIPENLRLGLQHRGRFEHRPGRPMPPSTAGKRLDIRP